MGVWIFSRSTGTLTRRSAISRAIIGYAQPPHLFLNDGRGAFRDVASQAAAASPRPRWRAGWLMAISTATAIWICCHHQSGPSRIYTGTTSPPAITRCGYGCIGTQSNRDAIGAVVRLTTPEGTQSRTVKTGSSYLSQSELTLTFGLGPRESASRVVVEWPSSAVQEFSQVAAGVYECTEGSQLRRQM